MCNDLVDVAQGEKGSLSGDKLVAEGPPDKISAATGALNFTGTALFVHLQDSKLLLLLYYNNMDI